MGVSNASGTADITVASLQSLISKDRLSKYDPSAFKLILVDEAHHIVAPGYLRTLEHFGLMDKDAVSSPTSQIPALVGVSATFSRFDGLSLGSAIDEIVYHKDYVDMIVAKWLSDVTFTTVESNADISRIKSSSTGDFQTSQLSNAVNTVQVNEITVRSWISKAGGGKRKSTLVFCVDLAHVTELTQKFRLHGLDARFVTGDTPKQQRSATLDAFKNLEFPILVNCGVFTEGTDIPNVDCVVLARPTKSRNLLVQMIGRGMRLSPGKKDCHVIDMVSSLAAGIVTTPTLFGLDPTEVVDNVSVDDLRKLADRKAEEADRAKTAYGSPSLDGAQNTSLSGAETTVTFTDYSSVFDLIADTSAEKFIRALSPHAWVQPTPEKYILAAPDGTFLRLERVSSSEKAKDPEIEYKAYHIRALPRDFPSPENSKSRRSKSPYAAPRQILSARTLADAVHGCDSFAAKHFPHVFISARHSWRREPPTDGQLQFLNKFRGEQDTLTGNDITKGRATDMITKICHGGRGRFAGLETGRRKREKTTLKLEKDEARQRQEKVSVGPLNSYSLD